jgi:hypothetical protein
MDCDMGTTSDTGIVIHPSFLVFKGVLYCFRKVCTLLLLFRDLIDITRTVLG